MIQMAQIAPHHHPDGLDSPNHKRLPRQGLRQMQQVTRHVPGPPAISTWPPTLQEDPQASHSK